MTEKDFREMEFATRIPAWTKLHVREFAGSRNLTAHEICVLKDVFDYLDATCAENDLHSDAATLAVTLGLIENVE